MLCRRCYIQERNLKKKDAKHLTSTSEKYECEKCGCITMFNVYDSCASVKCGGRLHKISHADLLANNHFARLYSTDLMKPLHIKEHTAQLGREEQQEYQELFPLNLIQVKFHPHG